MRGCGETDRDVHKPAEIQENRIVMSREIRNLDDILYIVMPAYNEEANIESVVRSWYPNLEGKDARSRLVIADSGSTDGTHAVLRRLQEELPQLEILEDTEKQHGPKLMALYRLAAERKAGYVFQTDSDGQTDPGEFAAFWELREEYDGIFGNRTVRGDGNSRAMVEKVVCMLLRLYFGVRVPDANAPFRLMRTDTVARYIGRLPENYALPNIMLTAWFAHEKERICFREITFRPRQGGMNSINIRRIFGIGRQAVRDFRRFRKEMGR